MKIIIAAPLVLAYVAAVFFGAPAVGPGRAEWLLPVLSVLFVWGYLRLVQGGPLVPLALVAMLTLVFPLTVLAWIGLPSHHTPWASLWAVLQFLGEHSPLWGLEMGISTLTAFAVALAVGRSGRGNQDVPHAL